MEYKKPLKRVFRKLKEILTPPPDLKISEWANTYRFLSGESSPERGKYNAQRAAYQIEMMDAFCDPKTAKKMQREENENIPPEKKSITVGFNQTQNQTKKTYKPASRPIT